MSDDKEMWLRGLFSHKEGLGHKMKNPVIGKYPRTKKNLAPRTVFTETQEGGESREPGCRSSEDSRTKNPRPDWDIPLTGAMVRFGMKSSLQEGLCTLHRERSRSSR